MFLNRLFISSTSLHVERVKPVVGPPVLFHRYRLSCLNKALVFQSMATGEVPTFQATTHLPMPTECFPRPAKLAGRRPPTEERHRASTYSLSIQQSTGSLPNVTLPPLVERPSYSTCAPPRMSPCDVSFVQRETNWNSRNVPHLQLATNVE